MTHKDLINYFNKILVFYYPQRAGYWNSITRCSISNKPIELGRYYLDFSSKTPYSGEYSKDGIPLFSYRNRTNIEHPTVIAQYAFGLFELLYRKNFNDKELKYKFLSIAQWFERNKKDIKGGKGWYINIKLPHYGLNKPWISAMTQGEVISVLTRAANLTGESYLEELAIEALGPFEFEVKDGGLINYFNSIPVYEEFPTPHKPMAVLNGFIFSLFGLYDLYLLNKNNKALTLFNKGVNSLQKLLPYYDLKKWSQYYLFDYPKKYYSSLTYHILVMEQLKVMYYLTGEKYFIEYSDKWNKYSKSFINKTGALYQKLFYSNKFIS